MGAIAEAFVEYARPLIDQTDGSPEQLQKAMDISQICFNLALMPDDVHDEMILKLQSTLHLNDEEFDQLRDSILAMIERHHEVFPMMHGWSLRGNSYLDPLPVFNHSSAASSGVATISKSVPKAQPYALCPCNSGEKYKFCCGKKRR